MQAEHPNLHIAGRFLRIGHLESDGLDFPGEVESIIDRLRSESSMDVFTFTQTLPHTRPQFRYRMEWDNFAALPITTFDNWWGKQIDFKVRNKARKGEKKGLSVREVPFDEEFARGISAIYNESPTRQGKAFWHYGKSLDRVIVENSTFPDCSILIGAFVDQRLVGFMKMVIDRNRQQAAVIQILSTIEHRDMAPTNALIARAVRSCADRKIPYLVYSNFAYGNKQDSLTNFKRYNGFQRIDIPRYYVPLTITGRAALRLGLQHKLAERVPEPILAQVRKARAIWYARKAQILKQAV
jgi:hypothetical protein